MTTSTSDLIERVTAFNRDGGGRYITPELVLGWLNEAYTDLAARLRLFDEEVSMTTDGTNTVSFPTDEELLEVLDLWIDDDHFIVIDNAGWDDMVVAGVTPTRTRYRIFENQIEMYPTPESGQTLKLRYKRLVQPLVDGDDEHQLPTQVERKMVEYAKSHSRSMDGDLEAAGYWMGLYESGLPKMSDGRERFFTQPVSISRRPNAWDLQPDRRHV
jgi:hypothetical protein